MPPKHIPVTPDQIELERLDVALNVHESKLEYARRLQNYHPLLALFAATLAACLELSILYPFEVCFI